MVGSGPGGIMAAFSEAGRGRARPEPDASVSALAWTGLIALAAAGATYWIVSRSSILSAPGADAVFRASFICVNAAVGLYTLRCRPGSRLGLLLIAICLLYAVASFDATDRPLAFTLGRLAMAATTLCVAHIFLAFPGDRLHRARDRSFLIGFGVASVAAWLFALAVAHRLPPGGVLADCAGRCPENPLRFVGSSSSLTTAADWLVVGITAAGLVGTAVAVALKLFGGSRPRHHGITPLLGLCAVFALLFAAQSVATQAQAVGHPEVIRGVAFALMLLVPLTLLAGQMQGQRAATAGLGRLLDDAEERPATAAGLERLIRAALGDDSVRLLLPAPATGGYVDVDGNALAEADSSSTQSMVRIGRRGRPRAVILHDSAVTEDPSLIEALGGAALMRLENERLLAELRRSRARLAAQADRERRRLEQDLHDGAQQRLVALQVRLERIAERLDAPDLRREFERVEQDAEIALQQLRDLGHGIYPVILGTSGLSAALKSAAREAPVTVRVDDPGIGRFEAEVESAAYFCTLEALQNAAKHAGSEVEVAVTLRATRELLTFSIADDGNGFDPRTTTGSGLIGMRDRIAAVGGRLTIDSAPAGGTTITGSVPLPPISTD